MSSQEDRLATVLGRFVDPEGKVDYSSLQDEIRVVEDYVQSIKIVNTKELATVNEKLAFWINVYKLALPSDPISLKSAEMMIIPFIPAFPHCSNTLGTVLAGVATIAKSTVLGSYSTV